MTKESLINMGLTEERSGTPAPNPGKKEPKDMSYDELTAYLAGSGKL